MEKSPRTPFGIVDGGIILGIVLLLGSLISTLLSGVTESIPDYKASVSYMIIPISIAIVVGAYLIVGNRKVDFLGDRQSIRPLSLALSPVVGVGLLAMLMLFNYLAVYIAEAVGYEMSVTTPVLDTPWQWVLAIFAVCVLPAVAEVVLFRGILLDSAKSFGTVIAIGYSALSFALFHFNPAQFVYPLLYGAGLSIIAYRTGTIVYGMIMHFVNNLLTLILTRSGAIAFLDTFSWANIGILVAIALSGFGVFIVAFLQMDKSEKKPPFVRVKDAYCTSGEKVGMIITLIVLVVVWLAMIIVNMVI